MKMMIITYMTLSVVISLLIFLVSLFFMENKVNEAGESPFECGFEPISFSRTPFSMQFFSITIIFLIFDLEIVIILPLMNSFQNEWLISLMISLITIVLLLGLIIEWYDGSLKWTV
uniref:NADH dehydrogenase subunit 3 n=1 Tax=Colpocephalum eucarenum TaxID=2965266 RepID=UPI0026E47FFB|nr:NADH dehydrogenase subunit 3 [Colpocephalum eucarenum]WIM51514.1 NADH dehydrogenase subunit 3 [Colpocephalum eucarenum]